MSAPIVQGPVIQGWCPSVHAPMAAADGLLVRVKPRVSGLGADQLIAVAEAARTYASGLIELTGRANLQVRGLSEKSAPRFAQAMVEAGLANPDPDVERRRNILAQADAGPELATMALELEHWVESEPALSHLPAKFGFALVAAGSSIPTGSDIALIQGAGWRVRLDGSPLVAEATRPLASVKALAAVFLALSDTLTPSPRRMSGLVQAIGVNAVFAHAGLRPAPMGCAAAPSERSMVGPDREAFGLGVALGAADATMLRVAADLSERFGVGRLFLTASRTFWLPHVPPTHHAALSALAAEASFIVDPLDPRLAVRACVGRQGCARTVADVRTDALRLAADWRSEDILHVSGCAKGCAHPRSALATLVAADDGRGYNLVLNGHARSEPSRFGLTPDEVSDLLSQDHSARHG